MIDLTNIQELLDKEQNPLQILVVSCGGSGSNTLTDALLKEGYCTRSPLWNRHLCHCPEYIDVRIPMIYIYRDIVAAFLSVKRRKDCYTVNHYKLSNDKDITLSDENLLRLMIRQFMSWTSTPRSNVLVIKYDELFDVAIQNKLNTFLSRFSLKNVTTFPIPFVQPKKIVPQTLSKEMNALFQKYGKEILHIQNFVPSSSFPSPK